MTKAGLEAFSHRTDARSATASYEQEVFPELSSIEVAHFRQNARAWAFYEKLPPSYRRKVNWVVISAKRPATREKRFRELVQACADGIRHYQWLPKSAAKPMSGIRSVK